MGTMDKCASKVVYTTRAVAKKMSKRIKRRGKGDMTCNKLYPYKCMTCPYWHLTKQGKYKGSKVVQ